MKKKPLFITYGALITISFIFTSHYAQAQSPLVAEAPTILDTLVAAHIISAPSAEEEAKRIEALTKEPPLTQKDIDTFLSLIPKFHQALSDKAEMGKILHKSGFSVMRFKYVGAKLGIATGAIARGGQQAETLLTQTQMPGYLRPTAAEMVLVRKNQAILNKNFIGIKNDASTNSASEEAKQIAAFKKEPPFTQEELASFIQIITKLTETGIDKDKIIEVITQSNLTPTRVIYIQTKVGLILPSLDQGGKEQAYRMQSKIPKHLRATPSELDLVIKNQAAIKNIYLNSSEVLWGK